MIDKDIGIRPQGFQHFFCAESQSVLLERWNEMNEYQKKLRILDTKKARKLKHIRKNNSTENHGHSIDPLTQKFALKLIDDDIQNQGGSYQQQRKQQGGFKLDEGNSAFSSVDELSGDDRTFDRIFDIVMQVCCGWAMPLKIAWNLNWTVWEIRGSSSSSSNSTPITV